ncbi:hypothetical protein OESDEN_21877 [Oesophagostomum dentatum]|uniref:SXP/RAL-2 family protein Ani s 5-like cation-binding domain-containing protein n=1 Tax=Oesophagostomum dentatum TaxID=61180 RepID=A0A0B1S3N6_OESDE|nr:hypothetical protein OESDEN_21877 [Oesophagostomum dentatum]
MADLRKELRKNVTELISQLPEASEKFSAVLNNEDLTPIQRCCALRNLTTENWKLYHVLKFAYGQFMIRQHRSHHGHGREGPFDQLEQMYAFVHSKECDESAEDVSGP